MSDILAYLEDASDLQYRKEFNWFDRWDIAEKKPKITDNILLRFMLSDMIKEHRFLELMGSQQFVSNFMNSYTPYTRLHMMWNTGAGKTIGSLSIAMRFISMYSKLSKEKEIGSVFIIGFSETVFKKELLRYPEFGFVTYADIEMMEQLRKRIYEGSLDAMERYKELVSNIKRKFTNRKGNGLFKFYGYKEFVNRMFPNTEQLAEYDINKIPDILAAIAAGKININKKLLLEFKNSLIICDEIHNVYNQTETNNWGMVLQVVLDLEPSVRFLSLSATPVNNPPEIIDLLNMLNPKLHLKRSDWFDGNIPIQPLTKLRPYMEGKFSYLFDISAEHFPRVEDVGESIPGIPHLKFIRCEMSSMHYSQYEKIVSDVLPQEYYYLTDFALPLPEVSYVQDEKIDKSNDQQPYKVSDISNIAICSKEWKDSNKLYYENGIKGEALHVSNIQKLSSKSYEMLRNLKQSIVNKEGKVFIYHDNVQLGVLFIEQQLIQNGYISSTSKPQSNTLCMHCGEQKKDHTAKSDHTFTAAKYILAHGEITKPKLDSLLDMYNSSENIYGEQVLILLGSRVIKESYDLKDTQNIYWMSRPKNITTYLQIRGRAVRKNSHIRLPLEKRIVRCKIFTSSIPGLRSLSYEENKFMKKMEIYATVREIEKLIHEYSIDKFIHPVHYDYFTPIENSSMLYERAPVKQLINSTYVLYYGKKELDLLKYCIKRLFIEYSSIWYKSDIISAVKNPPKHFHIAVNLELVKDEMIDLALYQLSEKITVSNTDYIKYPSTGTLLDTVNRMFDADCKYIVLNNKYYVIKELGDKNQTYYLTPIDSRNDFETPFRIVKKESDSRVSISKFIANKNIESDYKEKVGLFFYKYEETSIENMRDIITDYGIEFHIKFLEECIAYVYNIYTLQSAVQHPTMHTFYFKILYYYDMLNMVIFANTVKTKFYTFYSKLVKHVKVSIKDTALENYNVRHNKIKKARNRKEVKGLLKVKRVDGKHRKMHISKKPNKADDVSDQHGTSGVINLLSTEYNKSSSIWIPAEFRDNFSSSMKSIEDLFDKNGKRKQIELIPADKLPVGHYLSSNIRLYYDGIWHDEPTYKIADMQYKENDIIIGFDERLSGSLNVKFKLREPKQSLTKHKDGRLNHTGTVCKSKSKLELLNISSALHLDIYPEYTTDDICATIRSKLIRLELLERIAGTNLKYFYFSFEDQL